MSLHFAHFFCDVLWNRNDTDMEKTGGGLYEKETSGKKDMKETTFTHGL